MIIKLSKVFGKEVHTISGARAGRVADVAIDVDTRRISDIFITNLSEDFQKKYDLEGKKGIIFSYSGIKNIQDIVLISNFKPRAREPEEIAPAQEEME
jgi:sporulation protein YlmC with PRC-barrel domain